MRESGRSTHRDARSGLLRAPRVLPAVSVAAQGSTGYGIAILMRRIQSNTRKAAILQ